MIRCTVLESVLALAPYEPAWDRLAVTLGRPFCRPAWMRAWWTARCATAGAPRRRLQVVVAHDGPELVGILPLFVSDRSAWLPDYRMLGDQQFWGSQPLIAAHAPPGTLTAMGRVLTESTTPAARIIVPWTCAEPGWPEELAVGWQIEPACPGRVAVRRGCFEDTLVARGAYDDWFSARPQQWRAEIRRREMRARELGCRIGVADDEQSLRSDVAQLIRLHLARRNGRSDWLAPGMAHALSEACAELFRNGGVRLITLRREDEVVAASLFARAGSVSYLAMTAFDPRLRSVGPGLATAVSGIRDELESGVSTIDMGPGAFAYKRKLATERIPLARVELFPPGWRQAVARARWPNQRTRLALARLRSR